MLQRKTNSYRSQTEKVKSNNKKGRGFSNSITFNTLKNKGFSHITNCLIVETEKRPLAQSSLKTTEKMRFEYRRHVCFS